MMNEALGLALALSLSTAPVLAAEPPDLTGAWTGEYREMRWDGPAESQLVLTVIAQDGPLFKAEKSWKLEAGSSPGTVGGKLVSEATEPQVGVIDFDGRTVHLAEQGDLGTYRGTLTAPETLELVYVEAGDGASVYRIVLKRAK
jgi:hypothetical protein